MMRFVAEVFVILPSPWAENFRRTTHVMALASRQKVTTGSHFDRDILKFKIIAMMGRFILFHTTLLAWSIITTVATLSFRTFLRTFERQLQRLAPYILLSSKAPFLPSWSFESSYLAREEASWRSLSALKIAKFDHRLTNHGCGYKRPLIV